MMERSRDPHAVAAFLSQGELAILPTETYYSLSVRATDAEAAARLFACKGRDSRQPVALLAANVAQVREWVILPEPVPRLIERAWPGPLTLVLPLRPERRGALNHLGLMDDAVGLRVSPHPLLARVLRELDEPVTATSANRSGDPPCRTLDEVAAQLGADAPPIALDGGALPGGAPSSVVRIDRDSTITWIREGAVLRDEFERMLG